MKKLKNISLNEFLFSLYVLLFPTIGCFYKSGTINNFLIAIILLIFFIKNLKIKTINRNFIFINLFVILLFTISLIFNNNSMLSFYFKNYILYGFISMLLMIRVKKFNKVIDYMSFLLLIIYTLSFRDPFNGYKIYSGYMSYGLFCILPSFFAFHIKRKYQNCKLYIIPEFFCYFSMLFSNRNTIFICLLSIFILDFFVKKTDLKKSIKYIVLLLLLGVLIIYLSDIVNKLYILFGENSYPIRALMNGLNGAGNVLSGRDILWKNAIDEFNNNILLGIGIGGYESKYNIYCHNFYLEFICSFGIIGLFIFVFLCLKIISCIKFQKNNYFFWYLLLIGILPLMFNNCIFTWKYFWILIMYIFNFKRGEINE